MEKILRFVRRWIVEKREMRRTSTRRGAAILELRKLHKRMQKKKKDE